MFLILTICHVHSAVTQSEGRVPEYGGESISCGHDLKILIYCNASTERSACLSMCVLFFFFPIHVKPKTPADLSACSCRSAFPTSRWCHRTSKATWCSTGEPCECGPDRRGCSTAGSHSNGEPFTCTHCSGKNMQMNEGSAF